MPMISSIILSLTLHGLRRCLLFLGFVFTRFTPGFFCSAAPQPCPSLPPLDFLGFLHCFLLLAKHCAAVRPAARFLSHEGELKLNFALGRFHITTATLRASPKVKRLPLRSPTDFAGEGRSGNNPRLNPICAATLGHKIRPDQRTIRIR